MRYQCVPARPSGSFGHLGGDRMGDCCSPSPLRLSGHLSPRTSAGRQVEQVVPPSDTESAALLEGFLRARVDGKGAEQYVLHEPEECRSSRMCRSCTPRPAAPLRAIRDRTGAGPGLADRMDAGQGTAVRRGWDRGRAVVPCRPPEDGHLGLVYGYFDDGDSRRTENGQSVPMPNSILDGEVTFATAPPWRQGRGDILGSGSRLSAAATWASLATPNASDHGQPLPVATAADLARRPPTPRRSTESIRADPDLQTTAPVAVTSAGSTGCRWTWSPHRERASATGRLRRSR